MEHERWFALLNGSAHCTASGQTCVPATTKNRRFQLRTKPRRVAQGAQTKPMDLQRASKQAARDTHHRACRASPSTISWSECCDANAGVRSSVAEQRMGRSARSSQRQRSPVHSLPHCCVVRVLRHQEHTSAIRGPRDRSSAAISLACAQKVLRRWNRIDRASSVDSKPRESLKLRMFKAAPCVHQRFCHERRP
jgi:hypothetical protein